MASLYMAIAEHISEGRAPDIDPEAFRTWLMSIDVGADPTFEKIDDAFDELVRRYRELPWELSATTAAAEQER